MTNKLICHTSLQGSWDLVLLCTIHLSGSLNYSFHIAWKSALSIIRHSSLLCATLICIFSSSLLSKPCSWRWREWLLVGGKCRACSSIMECKVFLLSRPFSVSFFLLSLADNSLLLFHSLGFSLCFSTVWGVTHSAFVHYYPLSTLTVFAIFHYFAFHFISSSNKIYDF